MTSRPCDCYTGLLKFQYRKRYEATCDTKADVKQFAKDCMFQYRKRYEVTCDSESYNRSSDEMPVSIPQAV